MDYIQAFHEAYGTQQGLSPDEDCNVDHEQLSLLYETDRVWVVLNSGGCEGTWLNAVDKGLTNGQREMETIEL